MENLKKNKVFFITIISIFLLLIGFLLVNKLFLEKNNFKQITFKEVKDKIDNKESFVICFTQTTCSHCATFKPKLEKLANKYDVPVYYIEVDLLTKKEKKQLPKYINYGEGTPTTVFIKKGKETTVATRITGDLDYDKVVAKFKTNGFIK